MEGVGGAEQGAEFATGGVGLGPAFGGELDAVVRDGLVDVAVFWNGLGKRGLEARGGSERTVSFGLGVAHEDYHLEGLLVGRSLSGGGSIPWVCPSCCRRCAQGAEFSFFERIVTSQQALHMWIARRSHEQDSKSPYRAKNLNPKHSFILARQYSGQGRIYEVTMIITGDSTQSHPFVSLRSRGVVVPFVQAGHYAQHRSIVTLSS